MVTSKEGAGIVCLKCRSATAVKDSRPGKVDRIRRRRHCTNERCGHRFTTLEIPVEHLEDGK